jgi:hypothetical protein
VETVVHRLGLGRREHAYVRLVHGMGNAVIEAGTAEHLAFQHPQPVDVALDRA